MAGAKTAAVLATEVASDYEKSKVLRRLAAVEADEPQLYQYVNLVPSVDPTTSKSGCLAFAGQAIGQAILMLILIGVGIPLLLFLFIEFITL